MRSGTDNRRTGIETRTGLPSAVAVLAVLPVLLLPAGPARSGEMYGYVDESGTLVVTDRKDDPRARTYTPGDFQRWMLEQQNTPHAGVAVPFKPTGPIKASRWDGLIRTAATKHGVPYPLVRAVVAAESGFNPRATSRAGAQGLMQLMPATAKDLGVTDPFDPAANIEGGTRYLGGLLRTFQDERLALAAYNAGPGRVARLGRVPDFPETRAYIEKVLRLRSLYAHGDVVSGGGQAGD